MIKVLSLLAVMSLASSVEAQTPLSHTYANPIDIDYRYNFEEMNDGVSYRTGADPAVVVFKGQYYLFETLADGYWRSPDLVHWRFVTPSRWPFQSIVAPATLVDGDQLIIMPAAMGPQALLSTTDPASGKLDFYTRLTQRLPGSAFDGQDPKDGQIPSGTVGSGPVQGRRRPHLSLLGLVERISDLWHRTGCQASP